MADRQAALAALHEQLNRASRDPVWILSPEAERTAEAMHSAVRDPGDYPDAAYALGWYHWLRYQMVPKTECRFELAAAVAHFAVIDRIRPDGVPEPVHRALQRRPANSDEIHTDPDLVTARGLGLVTAYHRTSAQKPLEEAVTVFRTALDAVPAHSADRPRHLAVLGSALLTLFECTGRQELLTEAILVTRQAANTTPENSPEHASYLDVLGNTLRLSFERTGRLEALVEAARVGRQAVESIPQDHPARAGLLNNAGVTVRLLYERTGESGALLEAVRVGRDAVRLTPDTHPSRSKYLNNLGNTLRVLFEHTGQQEVLVEAVQAARAAVDTTPHGHADRASLLSGLSGALLVLSVAAGQTETLVEAVQVAREAVDATPEGHRDRAAYLNNLGAILLALSDRTGRLDAVVEAVQRARQALDITPADHPSRLKHLTNLGNALQRLSASTGEADALLEAVAAHRRVVEAVPRTDPNRVKYLNNLAGALHVHYQLAGQLDTLTERVLIAREVLEATPDENPDRPGRLINLGSALQELFARTGQLSALTEAMRLELQAVDMVDDGNPVLSEYLNSLGLALRMLFEYTGDADVLDEATRVARRAVEATPPDHPDLYKHLNSLGHALRVLFGRTAELDVLAEAVHVSRQGVAKAPAGHPDRGALLSSLALVLQLQAERTHRLDVLHEAARVARAAVEATPTTHVGRIGFLSNLGLVLRKLFEHTGRLETLDEAAAIARQAVEETPEGDPSLASFLGNLAVVLHFQAEHAGRLDMLDEAVRVARAAVDATASEHPNRTGHLTNLAKLLQFIHTHTNDLGALREARDRYREAAVSATGSTIHRIAAYRNLALLTDGTRDPAETRDPDEALRYLEAALELAEVFAPGNLGRADREYQLGLLANLPGEAAAAALNAGRPERAVELLERARGVLAADTLALRSDDHARLHRIRPDLADRVDRARALRAALDRPRSTSAVPEFMVSPQAQAQSDRRLAEQRREAHAAWHALLEEIRELPGFADFLRPPRIATLARHAHAGPVVLVTVGPTRADALILTDTPDPVHVIPLRSLTQDAVYGRANILATAARSAGTRDARAEVQRSAEQEILDVLAWLWDEVAEPVLTHLGHTRGPVGDTSWPRVWWCPVGVLAALPLHAAGHYPPRAAEHPGGYSAQPAHERAVPDLVVSSYTPTVRALAPDRTRPETPMNTLIIPVPDLPDAELPGVTDETAAIERLIPGAHALHQPTRDGVLAALPDYRVAHFACHGHADGDEPACSRLILADHATAPLTLADIAALNLDADLAFLSACDTAVPAPRLTDESLHITGAFQLAGYRHVIGTLWPIDDRAAAQIAEGFYAHLTTGGVPPRPDRAAHALHRATMRVRAECPDSPTRWAAHTHTGG